MKTLTLALLAAAGLAATTSARADSLHLRGTINFGGPAYVAPAPVYVPAPPAVVVAPPRGYWKEVVVNTWVPERWVHGRDRWGRPIRYVEPGHYERRTERVWVDAGRSWGHDHRDNAYNRDYRGGWNR